MESNDSEGTNPTSYDEITMSRYSKRVRKPIQIYMPEIAHSKPKKHEFDVNCEVIKFKGFSNMGANLSAFNVVKKFLRKARCDMPDCKFLYFCEKTKSKIYSGWKRLKNSEQLNLGNTYKIRAYKVKKMEKLDKNQIKRTEKKMAENPKPPARAQPNYSADPNVHGMMMMNMYYMMMYMQAMNQSAYNYYPPY